LVKKVEKPKILPSLLKLIIINFSVMLVSFIALNLYFAISLRSYEKASNFIHDYADLTQYGTTLFIKLRVAQNSNDKKEVTRIVALLESLAGDVDNRIEERRNSFEEIYTNKEVSDFEGYLSPLTSKNNENLLILSKEMISKKESHLEDSYISVLSFSNRHSEKMKGAFVYGLIIASIVLIIFIFVVLFFLRTKIVEIIAPLKDLTSVAEKLSISEEKLDIKINHEYYEYHILAISIRDMYQRVTYENRKESSESASNSVSHLVENIAHAINNPLATIATSLMLVKKKFKNNEDSFLLSEIDICLEQVNRVTEITLKMKSLISTSAKLEPSHFPVKNVNMLINLLYFNRFLEKKVKFESAEDMEFYGKEEVITNIIISLIENSLIHNNNNDPLISFSVVENDGSWLLNIHDNGDVPPLMDIYQYFLGDSTDKGVGLFTARKLAEENGYTLFYNESPQKEFVLEIPKPKETIA
jgi:two-component sensor histidine kinase/energy-coupling factor transporter transmembrane protein EcfT